ncbi:hypothetical protein [Allorhizobium taibaishanense]|uniref:Uncharacterized protein n=1 Tax=Allorhizobium taibaishanense TaxID=887144 RepID=A0A1Q9A2R6_9HYPH|nr:hypothetical protein [Allorhizobium taibaishanense]MBB4005833.1 hypothetical protein [Allorhizobium taibaishanense]OLP48880.1 hypothetical protein BJF91_17245 [Allorhizobium taibaishanense]
MIQDAFAALYASLYVILTIWVIALCLGLVASLWNRNSRLREDNYDLRIRVITAEAALAFAEQLPSLQAKSDFLWEYMFGGSYVGAMHPSWPKFLHARISAALDTRS